MTKLVFIDTETTSLRPDRRVWEVGLIERQLSPGVNGRLERFSVDKENSWFIEAKDCDLGNADPFALNVGKFHSRHPEMAFNYAAKCRDEKYVLAEVERRTRGAHLVGAVVSFDAEVLAARMRANGISPSWHYHLIDVEAMAVGYLNRVRVKSEVEGCSYEAPSLPWKSDDLSAALAVEPTPDKERHTALGDARWAMRMYDAMTS